MFEETIGVIFFLKKSKTPKTKLHYIYQRITLQGISKEWSIKRKWYSDRWNRKIGRATDAKEDAKLLNRYLESLTAKVLRAERQLLDEDKVITALAVKNLIAGTPVKPKMLLEEFQIHNDQMETLVGRENGYSKGTHERFVTACSHTKAFISYKYAKSDLSLKSLNYEFISGFALWLRTLHKCSYNTTMKYLTNMKKIVLLCIKKGLLKRDPFVAFPLAMKEVKKPFLTIEELRSMMNKVLPSFRLTLVRDVFIFSCFTGLAFSDLKKLKQTDIVMLDDTRWIMLSRTKTKVESKIPILPQAQAILDKYNTYDNRLSAGLVIPMITNQKMNIYLKEIAELCEISKILTFHAARHTFATTITLRYGVSISSLGAMMGHKGISQTHYYAVVQMARIKEEMGILQEKLEADLNKEQKSPTLLPNE